MAHLHKTGTRDELIAELEDRAEGWSHMGRADRAQASRDAAQQLRDGEVEVMAVQTWYYATD